MPPPSKRRPDLSPSPMRPSKKGRTVQPPRGDSPVRDVPYKNGAIRRIQLMDFMTHQSFDMEPHPKINIISGVNGSGKSSILLGIAVGLGKNFVWKISDNLKVKPCFFFQVPKLPLRNGVPN